jgi:hypothetical protein
VQTVDITHAVEEWGGVVEKLEDLLTRFGNNVASSEGQSAANTEGQVRGLLCCPIVIPTAISSLLTSWNGRSRMTGIRFRAKRFGLLGAVDLEFINHREAF